MKKHVTPEYFAKYGDDLVPAGIQGEVAGKTVHTTYRRKTPLERIRALEPHELMAGKKLHEVFRASRIESVGAVDCTRAVVDTSMADYTPEHVLDARDRLNGALRALAPETTPIVNEIVIDEVPIMAFCNRRRCGRKTAVKVLRRGLESLAIYFGYSTRR